MPLPAAEYSRDFLAHPDIARWGVGVTGSGVSRVKAGMAGDRFDRERGRMLDGMHIVLITSGEGMFETREGGPRAVAAGAAFAIPPQVWHRYSPAPGGSWTESWVELRGPVVDRLAGTPLFAPDARVKEGAIPGALNAALDAVHQQARTASSGFDPQLSALGLGVLAAWSNASQTQPQRRRIAQAVREAERFLTEHQTEPVNIAALAQKLGIAYSYFRRAFAEHTGFSPWQYVLHLRLQQARKMLASGDATLEEIAQRLGFSSAFHLSTVFKRTFGISPRHWRDRQP